MNAGPAQQLFRAEAIAHHAAARSDGQVLRLSRRWIRRTFWVVSAAAVTSILYALFGTVDEYAAGPALVRIEERTDVTARVAGTVASVSVQPGDRVVAGQPLVQFCVDEEEAELERLQKEFDLQVLKLLRDPTESSARQTLASLRAQRDLAIAKRDKRLVRAPHAGVVSNLRIRPGHHLEVGELVLSILPDDGQPSVVALLPGRYRPMLAPGMSMRFELEGYRYEYSDLTILSVGDSVIGPAEVKRYLGAQLADSLVLAGPVVLVRARLDSRSFSSEGREYDYYDGLHAFAQARVRRERIALVLLPGLKELFAHGR